MALKSKANQETREHPDMDKALAELRKGPTKRLNLDIPEEMHRRLKVLASNKGMTIKELLIPSIEDLLK